MLYTAKATADNIYSRAHHRLTATVEAATPELAEAEMERAVEEYLYQTESDQPRDIRILTIRPAKKSAIVGVVLDFFR